jgi:hypothetical protein
LSFLDFIDETYQENYFLSNDNLYTIYDKKNKSIDLILDIEYTSNNSNLIFLKNKFSFSADFTDDKNDGKNKDFTSTNYFLINSHVRELAKAYKYNLEIHLERMKELILAKNNNLVFLKLESENFRKIFEKLKSLNFSDLTMKLFFEKIILKIFLELTNFISPSIYYSKAGLISIFEEFTIITKNLIFKFYY